MTIAPALSETLAKIRRAERLAGRPENSARLIAVTKTQPDSAIDSVLATGHRLFGENKVQEAQIRWTQRKAADPSIRLHLIGPLQTNKAADAVALFDMIETLDREKLARTLAGAMAEQGRRIPCLIQVNTGNEPQKAGIAPRELDDFNVFCRADCALEIKGLMCIPPPDDPAGLHFAWLKQQASRLSVPVLSMGMSGDYETAIRAGATHVRIGSAIFGARETPPS